MKQFMLEWLMVVIALGITIAAVGVIPWLMEHFIRWI